MIIYNVTIKVDHSIYNEWLLWMKAEHIQEVLETKCFNSADVFHLVEHDDSEGKTFSVQYKCNSFDVLKRYNEEFAPALKEKVAKKFGDKALSFRTILKQV